MDIVIDWFISCEELVVTMKSFNVLQGTKRKQCKGFVKQLSIPNNVNVRDASVLLKAVIEMTNLVCEQILAVRETGLTNMFDIPAVQRIAFDLGYYELVDWLIDHQKEYAKFIMTGE